MKKDLIKQAYKGYADDWLKAKFKKVPSKKIHVNEYEDDLQSGRVISRLVKRYHYIDGSLLNKVLHKHVGRPWNKVYSELINSTEYASEAAKTELKTWLKSNIVPGIEFRDGKVFGCMKYRAEISELNKDFYVHPKTGILSFYNKKPKPKKLKPIATIKISESEGYRLIDDKWYRCTFEIVEGRCYRSTDYRESYERKMLKEGRWEIPQPNFNFSNYAWRDFDIKVTRKSCNKKDLKFIQDYISEQEKNG